MSAKNLDGHGRWRSKTIAFRVSPEEDSQIDIAVQLSGLTKQDYITAKLLDRTVVVQGNCKVHRAVIDRLKEVLDELVRIENGASIDDELMENIALITGLVDGLYEKAAPV
jgi:hypothetical protein